MRTLRGLVLALSVLAVTGLAGPRPARVPTALDRYVAKPDASYRFRLADTLAAQGCKAYILDLVSQTWRSPSELDRPEWQHWLTVFRPAEVRSGTALLILSGGSNGNGSPRAIDPVLSAVAITTGTVVAELRMVPNEPITFTAEGRPRTEDSIIAYSWERYLRTGDETWPLRLPMTKSAVRAMDAVTTFCGRLPDNPVAVERFVVAGGSKRGWTAWTTAAVDDRVIALAPFVIDTLNLEKAMDHHFRAYGFWAPAIRDYTDIGLSDWSGTRQFRKLLEIEDPYSYRDRLTMPKLIVNSTGDQYFLPDSSRFYVQDLKGETHLRYIPNTKHNLNIEAVQALATFYESIVRGAARPRYAWRFEPGGAIVVEATDRPAEVRVWRATNPKARDFRLDTLGPAWTSEPLAAGSDGSYRAEVPGPAEGWTAFFVELTYPSGGRFPFKFTSGVRITPDRLPFDPPRRSPRG